MKSFVLHIAVFFVLSSAVFADEFVPIVSIEDQDCGTYLVTVTDEGEGIFILPKINKDIFYNFNEYELIDDFHEGQANHTFSFTFTVKNPFDDAEVEFSLFDTPNLSTGNPVTKRIEYIYKPLLLDPHTINYGTYTISDSKKWTVEVQNEKYENIIKSISISDGTNFELENTIMADLKMKPFFRHYIFVNFNPKTIGNPLRDTIIIRTDCENITYKIPLEGTAISPIINVTDIDFGNVLYGETYEVSDIEQKLKISNSGIGELELKTYQFASGKYYKLGAKENYILYGNARIPENQSITLHSLELKADKLGEIIDTITFKSNAYKKDSIAILKAYCIPRGIFLNAHDFGDVRINATKINELKIINTADEPIEIIDFYSNTTANELTADFDNALPELKKGTIIYPQNYSGNELKEITIPISFTPIDERKYEREIYIAFKEISQDSNQQQIRSLIKGRGVQQKVLASGFKFPKATATIDTSEITGYITIKNISNSAPLYLNQIDFINPINPAIKSFIIPDFPSDTLIEIGESLQIPVNFVPKLIGENKVNLRIRTDAYRLPQDSVYIDTLISISGIGYKKPLSMDLLKFGNICRCETKTGSLSIKNESEKDVLIDSVIISSNSQSPETFAIKSNTDNILIKSLENHDIEIDYIPFMSNLSSNSAIIKVFYGDEISKTYIFGNNYTNELEIALDSVFNITPGVVLKDGNRRIGINIKQKNISDSSFLNHLKFGIRYRASQIKFLNSFSIANLPSSATIKTDYNLLNNNTSEITFTVDSDEILPDNFTIYPELQMLLSQSALCTLEVHNIKTVGNCYDTVTTNGLITYRYCGLEQMEISMLNKDLKIIYVMPNPATGDEVNIRFSVPFDMMTTLDFYDETAKHVLTAYRGVLEKGTHDIKIDISNLSSNTYTIILRQSEFSDMKNLYIFK